VFRDKGELKNRKGRGASEPLRGTNTKAANTSSRRGLHYPPETQLGNKDHRINRKNEKRGAKSKIKGGHNLLNRKQREDGVLGAHKGDEKEMGEKKGRKEKGEPKER